MLRNFSAPRSVKGTRLLAVLKERLTMTTKEIRWLVEHNRCQVNGSVERFCSTKLYGGEKVRIQLSGKKPPSFDRQRILFEDDCFIVYSKPANLSSEEIAAASETYLVHRLDRDTTGLFLLAKTEKAQAQMEALFRERKVKKEYLAIVKGTPLTDSGEIKSSLEVGARREGAVLMRVAKKGGKKCHTSWQVLKRERGLSFLLCTPHTGRTHQIRVHLASIELPILGDVDYGPKELQEKVLRPLLHAFRLSFPHPQTGEEVSWKLPPPKEYNNFISGASYVQNRS
jgi:23S rRNA pseudouridine955/2504/2580 synthase